MTHLEEVIVRYATLKAEMESYKPQVNADNTEIKQLMRNGEKPSENFEYTATYSVIDKSYFNEDALLLKLKELGHTECIKTKEYVDMDLLENELYQGTITTDEIKECKVDKKEERLVVKKTKKE